MIRSWLLVAAKPHALDSDVNADADRLVIDLAGCESGAEQKARETAVEFLRAGTASGRSAKLCVRIHDFASREAEADVAAVIPHGVSLILLPAAENGAAVQRLDVCLSVAEVRAGLKPGRTDIVAMNGDNPSGLLQAASFYGKSSRLRGLGWDAAGLAGTLGATRQLSDDGVWCGPMVMARSTLLLTAAQCGVAAIDTVAVPCPSDQFHRLCREARADGFAGKMTRDSAQLSIINAVFGGDPLSR
jgi:citrate lyase subunit beta/citryl-CoA lyase